MELRQSEISPRAFLFLLSTTAVLTLSGCQGQGEKATHSGHAVQPPAPGPTVSGMKPGAVRLTAGSPPEDGQWTMPAKDYASTRYSGLDQITVGNVKDLKVAWTFSTGFLGGHEAAPLVVATRCTSSRPSRTTSTPSTSPSPGRRSSGATSRSPTPPRRASPAATSSIAAPPTPTARSSSTRSTTTRSRSTPQTGKEVWRTKVGDINRGETMTMAPLVVKGKVLVGNSGGEFGVRGWLTGARRRDRQDRLARLHHRPRHRRADRPGLQAVLRAGPGQGPGRHHLAGRPVEDRRRHGVGLDLVRPRARPDLLRHRQSRAVEPRAAPRRQQVDGRHLRARAGHRRRRAGPTRSTRTTCTTTTASTRTCCSTCRSNGKPRKVLVHPDRNGYIYVMDRHDRRGALGRRRSSTSTRATGVDLKTGRPASTSRRSSRRLGKVVRDICPPHPGAKDWQPSAFSPRTGLLYIPHNNSAWTTRGSRPTTSPARPTSAPTCKMYAGPRRQSRRVHRLGPGRRQARCGRSRRTSRSGAARWRPPATSSSTARWTAGSRRSTRTTGELLWQFKTGSGIIGQPITYQRAGRQAVRRDPLGRRRLGRRHRLRRPRPARRHRRRSASSTR